MPGSTLNGLLTLASSLRKADRVHEAIDAYERLLAEHPDLPDSWYNLALLQRRSRRFHAALTSYRQALDRGVSEPEEVHLNRAVIFIDHLARPEDAEHELAAALRCNPRYVPAWLNLGNLHEDRGERNAARAAYEKVLAIEPFHAMALARWANLQPRDSAPSPLIARLEAALARPGIGLAERADLGFGLGAALDHAGNYDKAFAAYSAANRASRAAAGAQVTRYDRAAHERLIDDLIHAFPEPLPKAGSNNGAPDLIFICGMFRSGSSLLEHMLARHPSVTAGGELDLLPAIARDRLTPFPQAVTALDAAALQRLQTLYLNGVATLFPGATVVTDKRPDNFLFIGLIKALFPNAKVIHTQRAALDNCLSVFFLHLDRSRPYAFDLLDIAHWFGQYRRLMGHWKKLFGDEVHDVVYDELVSEPAAVVRKLLTHCSLSWNDACLSFHQSNASVRTASVWQVREPLYRRSSGRWRNYESHLGELRAALAAHLPT